MRKTILAIRFRLWLLKARMQRFILSLTYGDQLTIASFLLSVAEKWNNLQAWTLSDSISTCGVMYLVWDKWQCTKQREEP